MKKPAKNDVILHEVLFKIKKDMTEDLVWEMLLKLNHTILRGDSTWHFFYEEDYIIIRCLEKFIFSIKRFLRQHGFEVAHTGQWIDSEVVVENNKQLFTQLFHLNTLFAIKELDIDTLKIVHDRYSHCFLNSQFFNFRPLRSMVGNHQWEGVVLAEYLSDRLFYNAKYKQSRKDS